MARQLTQWLGATAVATSITAVFVMWQANTSAERSREQQVEEMAELSARLTAMQSRLQKSQARQEVRLGSVVERTRYLPEIVTIEAAKASTDRPAEFDPGETERLDRLADDCRQRIDGILDAGSVNPREGTELRSMLAGLDRDRYMSVVSQLSWAINNDELSVENIDAIPF